MKFRPKVTAFALKCLDEIYDKLDPNKYEFEFYCNYGTPDNKYILFYLVQEMNIKSFNYNIRILNYYPPNLINLFITQSKNKTYNHDVDVILSCRDLKYKHVIKILYRRNVLVTQNKILQESIKIIYPIYKYGEYLRFTHKELPEIIGMNLYQDRLNKIIDKITNHGKT